ncbi:MAG TPA: hypothetical protein DEF39_05435 [Hungateiclostridium thermocellum]|uniref:DUF948 domain-containing protein n=2 Tax=Acetivibrio thermocellus TaxID=1515 RepID=A3DBI9_ACET2|nr:DUF948 domain-containing protein [Acetivibrio thermocellus]CDG34760.1 hypothetical protein CTHBC1_0082 [Acetivibrio thermocellus BC1]ABN51318.1 hypothetical protein Cthe_0077 [Acetivibrio thermocellus ATCC 27405]ADU75195.1 hypothetical protein Clo1313_2154 [Acetivibrio thermocellus DSM 1313]ALX09170.1 hypothetical protein AD2_02182 [Acetivibrio thermocellus AD2]ANV76922.1 hypothetical protein LQRI_2181 [Acetivibrio thermocellus DSM 2360]
MSVTISYDLANFIMYTLGAVLIIVAVITLLNVNRFVKRLDKLVEKNEENFNKTANTIPEIAKNVNEVTIGVKQNVDKVGEAIDAVEDSVCDSILNLLEGTEGLFDFISIVGEVIKALLKRITLGKGK